MSTRSGLPQVESEYSRGSCFRNHILSVRSKPVSYRMRLVSREYSSFLFEELPQF